MRFNQARILRKYERPYTLIREGEGNWNSVGVYQPPETQRIDLRGSIQPLGDKLTQTDGGRYTVDDRLLLTTFQHDAGDVVEHQGKQYTVESDSDWNQYSNVNEYRLKRVSTHDPVRKDPESDD
ncbi:hypothetical protein BK129_01520 [Paenibacillus amylolyticus]|uniref:hypothetical protein n=1 Tax=Paenibacillus amylolyticus TaxID=1451 RepID=UPI00096C401E|nr:hypothetical protein [Paenibacillus amylolyticus]OMF09562.1 hypothetical protein BK129_01520 [Paenibacillus amylolyticus]